MIASSAPIRRLDIELSREMPDLAADDSRPWTRALVRLHGHPLGTVEYPAKSDGADVERVIWDSLGAAISAHACGDGLAAGPADVRLALGDPPCCRGGPSPGDAPLVSVVVPTHNRPDHLRRCLASLLALDYPAFEVVVVDNFARTEPATSVVAEIADARVRLRHEPNGGSSAARNAGVAAATGELIACTDDDVEVDTKWLTMAVRRLWLERDVACVTGLVEPAALDTPAQVLFEEYGGFGKGFSRAVFDRSPARAPTPLYPRAPGVFGPRHNVVFRAADLRDLGAYDLSFGPGSPIGAAQDLDLFLRVIQSGRRIAYEPAAIVRHHHRAELSALERQVHDYGRGMSALLTKWALTDRTYAFDIVRRTPRGARWLLSSRSSKNAHRSAAYPPALWRAELAGLATGWAAWLRARRDLEVAA